jgi:hypothetical protein
MTAGEIVEQLKPCPFCGGEAQRLTRWTGCMARKRKLDPIRLGIRGSPQQGALSLPAQRILLLPAEPFHQGIPAAYSEAKLKAMGSLRICALAPSLAPSATCCRASTRA